MLLRALSESAHLKSIRRELLLLPDTRTFLARRVEALLVKYVRRSERADYYASNLHYWAHQPAHLSTQRLVGHLDSLSVVPLNQEEVEIVAKGWLIGVSAPVKEISFIPCAGENSIILSGLPREDVAEAFPGEQFARRSGFCAVLRVPRGDFQETSDFPFSVQFADGTSCSGSFGPVRAGVWPEIPWTKSECANDIRSLLPTGAPRRVLCVQCGRDLPRYLPMISDEDGGTADILVFSFAAPEAADAEELGSYSVFELHDKEGLHALLAFYKRRVETIIVCGRALYQQVLDAPLALASQPEGAKIRLLDLTEASQEQPFEPEYIVIHHSATAPDQSVAAIRDYHRSRGWDDIGYHVLVDSGGQVHEGRPLSQAGAHALRFNHRSLGVCCVGNFEEEQPSTEMLDALIRVVSDLCRAHRIPAENVIGHFEVGNYTAEACSTLCPGRHVKERLAEIKEKVRAGISSDCLMGHH